MKFTIHNLRMIKARFSSNGWVLAELFLVFIVMWFLCDSLGCMKYTFYRPLGYNIEHVYKLSTVVGGESRDTSLTDADKYLGILAKLEQEPSVEAAALCYWSLPMSGSNSYNALVVQDTSWVQGRCIYTTGGYMDVFRISEDPRHPFRDTPAGWNNVTLSNAAFERFRKKMPEFSQTTPLGNGDSVTIIKQMGKTGAFRSYRYGVDELIPSGETSSYRSNPLGLAEFALSRKDPAYVGRAKEVQKAQKAIEAGTCPLDALEELKPVMSKIQAAYPEVGEGNVGVGSTIFAVKPGDGSAREQAASCQKVLGGWANIAVEYATKRYRSNLINWGMLPFLTDADHEALPFKNGDYIFVPNVRKAVEEKKDVINAYVVGDELKEIQLKLGDLTDAERQIILDGCLINYYKATK